MEPMTSEGTDGNSDRNRPRTPGIRLSASPYVLRGRFRRLEFEPQLPLLIQSLLSPLTHHGSDCTRYCSMLAFPPRIASYNDEKPGICACEDS